LIVIGLRRASAGALALFYLLTFLDFRDKIFSTEGEENRGSVPFGTEDVA
jgi:hypothetical protein